MPRPRRSSSALRRTLRAVSPLIIAGILTACAPAGAASAHPPQGPLGTPADGAASTSPQNPGQRPGLDGRPLVVLVVVDQLRGDLLQRYAPFFDGGLGRLLSEGRSYGNVTMDHLVTETAPGHATISTGTSPAEHGVVSNFWWAPQGRGWLGIENVMDSTTQIVGAPALAGASGRVLERSGVADWLLEAHPGARVVSVSGKARGAVLLAGQGADRRDVYWFEPAAGTFVTSTYYGDAVAPWIRAFNRDRLPAFRSDTLWSSTIPAEAAALTRPDTADFESDLDTSFFPHSYGRARASMAGGLDFWEWWSGTPGLDAATLEVAARAVSATELGRDETPDLLAVSLSQTDRVGHGYGPRSREQLDNLLRLDDALATFFARLDDEVGAGRWSLVLTSDHGAMDMPEAPESGTPGLRLGAEQLQELQALVGQVSRRVRSTDPATLAQPLADAVEELPWVARAWSHDDLRRSEPSDSFGDLARAGFHPGRLPGLLGRLGVEFQVAPGVLPFGFETRGSTHQSGYHHDRWIPLILLGPGIEPGRAGERVGGTAIAPTLAALLGIDPPDDLPGGALVRPSSSPAPSGSASRRP